MNKTIQKPSQMAAVENAARMVANTGATVLQAACTDSPLQSGCKSPLQAGCVQQSPLESSLLAGCIADGIGGIAAKK